MAKEEWGPWVEHDGKGCPEPIGTVVEIDCSLGRERTTFIETIRNDAPDMWSRPNKHGFFIDRYRIRRPRGMAVLDEILAEAEKVKEGEVV